jgi:malic enzyme
MKIVGKNLSDCKIVTIGAGAAGTAQIKCHFTTSFVLENQSNNLLRYFP